MVKNVSKKIKDLNFSSIMALILAYLVIFVAFSFMSPYFCTWRNFQSILKFASTMGIIASGMTFIICAGSLDLSAGTVAALSSVICAFFLERVDSAVLAVVMGIALGILCGVINSVVITGLKINPFITTLATQNIFKGLAFIITGGSAIPIRNVLFNKIAQSRILGFPVIALYFLIIIIIMGLSLKHTRFGRSVYSVGGNPEASFLSGISVKKTRFKIYVLSGFLAAVSGVLNASLTGTGQPSSFTDTAMDAISAVILGGCALSGGKGNMFGTFVGVIIFATLDNGMTLLSISSFYQMVLKGIILLLAVAIDVIRGSGGYE